jgi:bacteriocin biosynthesis cyclodehydratase domain-containing protein
VRETLEALRGLGALEDAAGDDAVPDGERMRWDRQLRYFADMDAAGLGAAAYHSRVRESRVALLGLGGLGSWAALALACCGVGRLRIVDGDVVEESNFNRQVLYRESDVGRLKTDAAAETLAGFSSHTAIEALPARLESSADVEDAVRGCDFVVNAVDWPAHDIERWVNAAVFAVGVPAITMSHSPPVARVGPLYVPGRTGCFECQERAYRSEFPLYDDLVEQRRGRASSAATLGPVCAIVGGQVALEALHHITGLCDPATLGTAWLYDLRTMEITREAVPHDPECPVCAAQ